MKCLLFSSLISLQIVLSYSQFLCEPNSACVINCNSSNSSCTSQTIDALQATSLELYCESPLCRAVKVLCPINNTASCNIFCDGLQSCSGIGSSKPSVINSSLSSTLNVQCNGEYSCAYMLTYGPNGPLTTANIDCNGEYACSSFGAWRFNQDYYLSNTANVDITCNGASSCRSSDYYVEYSDIVHIKSTSAGTHSAEKVRIYGSHITSMLYMECHEYQGCLYLDVYCPFTASCILNSTSYNTAYNVDIFLQNESVSDVFFDGYGEFTLRCVDNAISNELISFENKYYCAYSSNGCCPDTFKVATPAITCEQSQECIVNCDGGTTHNCRFMIIDASLATSLTVYCDDGTWTNYACQAATIICPIGGNCNVLCSDENSCNYITIKGDNINDMSMQCPQSHGCKYSKIYANVNGATQILCGSSYSCVDAEFVINGNQNINNNINLTCIGWGSCDGMSLNAKNNNDVSVSCIDISGSSEEVCKDINIYSSESNTLSLLCDAVSGCENANVYCPYDQLNACSVQCNDISGSCYNLNILAHDNYMTGYLLLDCPSQPINQPQCNTIDFMCSPSNSRTDYTYDGVNYVYLCSNQDCCPILPTVLSPTSSPITESPTTPTTSDTPTGIPTSIPTSIPPSVTPSVPTRIPTRIPTSIPTGVPTTVPTDKTAIDTGNNSNYIKLSVLFTITNVFNIFCMF